MSPRTDRQLLEELVAHVSALATEQRRIMALLEKEIDPTKKLLSPQKIAARFSIGKRRVYDLLEHHGLKSIRIRGKGGRLTHLIDPDDVAVLLPMADHRIGSQGAPA